MNAARTGLGGAGRAVLDFDHASRFARRPPTPDPAPSVPVRRRASLELFLAFAKMSLAGFGGVLVWARRIIVEQHRWMTAEEFNETFALCHFLPGPNIVNLSVVFGSRIRGIAGGIAAFAGLIGPPVVIATCWRRSMRATAMSSAAPDRWPASPAPRSGCSSRWCCA